MTRFGTFWKGPSLSALEAACLHTFVAGGHDATLFSYEPVANVPIEVEQTVGPDRASSAGVRRLPWPWRARATGSRHSRVWRDAFRGAG